MRRMVFCAVVATGAAVALGAVTGDTIGVRAALKPYVDRQEIPGYVSVLIDGDREEWTIDGWCDMEKKTPIRKDSLFRICSQTKGFIGALAAKLIVEGKLSLEDPISKYFPEFRTLRRIESEKDGVRTTVPVKNVLTLRDCLSHTGGIPFETPLSKALGWTSTPPRIAAAAAAADPLLFEPGTNWKYSNAGIDVAMAVIEKVTCEKIEDLLKRVFFDPLGMKDTTFKPNAEQQSRLVSIYAVKTGQVCRLVKTYKALPEPYDSADRYPSGGAGLFSTPHDLLEFYRMLAFGGVARNGRRVLPADAIYKYLAVKQTAKAVNTSYSLGMFVNGSWFGHDGALKTACLVEPNLHQVRFWMMQADYYTANRWHQFNVWRPVANKFFNDKVTSNSGADVWFSVFRWTLDAVAKQRGISLEQAAALAYDAGVRGYDCEYCDARGLETLAKTKLKPASIFGQMNFYAPDGGKAQCDAFVASAKKYGSPRIMCLPTNFTGGIENEAEYAKNRDGIKYLVAKAKANGITTTVEDFGCKENPCSRAKCIIRLLKDIPDLAFAVDSGNLYYLNPNDAKEILEVVKFAGKRVAHVHLKDQPKENPKSYVTLGAGQVPNEEIVKSVATWGYSGWYTLENPVGDDLLADISRQVGVVKRWLSTVQRGSR